jgi:hypothetical protein
MFSTVTLNCISVAICSKIRRTVFNSANENGLKSRDTDYLRNACIYNSVLFIISKTNLHVLLGDVSQRIALLAAKANSATAL